MKIIHIIPSAFEYFNSIRTLAFEVVEQQNQIGESVDAITLQYGTTSKRLKKEVKKSSVSRKFLGTMPAGQVIKNLDKYDVVHLHTPFLGGAHDIVKWAKNRRQTLFVITYYYDFKDEDFIGKIIKWYNNYYLPKMFGFSNRIFVFGIEEFIKTKMFKKLPIHAKVLPILPDRFEKKDELFHLTLDGEEVILNHQELYSFIAYNYLEVYNFLKQTVKNK